MIFFYTTKEDVSEQTKDILNNCNYELLSQKQKLNILLQILKYLNTIIQDTEYIEETTSITDFLRNLKYNIDALRNNINNLQKFINSVNIFSNGLAESPDELDIPSIIEKFNQIIIDSREDIEKSDTEFYNLMLQFINNAKFNLSVNPNNASYKDTNSDIPSQNIVENNTRIEESSITDTNNSSDEEITDNNVLLISEKQKKVFLPYKVKDLKQILRHNKSYNSLQDVISHQFIVSINRYKNPIISRFRETYNLMKKREKASISDSLDLALGLTFNSSLNPAIITACRNLEELDTYLDCLELNELSKFEYFEVKYEIAPSKR